VVKTIQFDDCDDGTIQPVKSDVALDIPGPQVKHCTNCTSTAMCLLSNTFLVKHVERDCVDQH